jgi:hypothetical protein
MSRRGTRQFHHTTTDGGTDVTSDLATPTCCTNPVLSISGGHHGIPAGRWYCTRCLVAVAS